MENLLLQIKQSGIRINVNGDNLKLKIPKDFNNDSLLENIKRNKVELIDYVEKSRDKKDKFRNIPTSENRTFSRLTSSQLRLFAVEGLTKDANVYNIPFAYEINGSLDVKQMQNSFVELIQRHESLRTYFELDENHIPIQKVEENFDFELEYGVCSEQEFEKIKEDFSYSFDLNKAPLIRSKLLKIEEERFILLVDIHHIVFDGISMKIFMKDLFALYHKAELPALDFRYIDYANWYNSDDYQANLKVQKKFWENRFKNYKNTSNLPTDSKKQNEISFNGAYSNFTITKERKRAIEEFAKKYDGSIFSVLSCLYGILQAKLTGSNDLAIGTPVVGRRHWSLENIIGLFVNTLAIRLRPENEMTFDTYLKQVNDDVMQCFDNQEYPYETLVEDLRVAKNNQKNPLFNTLLSLNNFGENVGFKTGDLTVNPIEVEKTTAKFDLSIHFFEKKESIDCIFEYNTELFEEKTIQRFFDYFVTIIDQVSDDEYMTLGEISLLDYPSQKALMKLNDFTDIDFSRDLSLIEIFEDQVAKTPENIALVFEEHAMTYKEVNSKANQLARMLRSKGVGRNDAVGVLMDKNMQVVISMLGILKAGGAYVPIDVNYPQDRIDYIIENSKLKWVLSSGQYSTLVNRKDTLIVNVLEAENFADISNLPVMNHPEDLCYVIYTSGTTGMPKGVMIEHKNVVRLLFNDKFQFEFTDKDVWTMFHSHCFDFSVWEMYGPLLYGGKLVIVSQSDAKDPNTYLDILQKHKVTILNQTPTAFYSLNNACEQREITLPDVRYVIFGGEALIPSKLKRWKEVHPKAKLINMYGITEITVHTTYKEIGHEEIEKGVGNLGKALPTGSIYLLDHNLKQVPFGVLGEIYVGGYGVARGYMNNEELTNSRFIENPFNAGDRLYKSGDFAVLHTNGDLEYKGRIDRQVQLKGFRIELKEIEHHLNQFELIDDVVITKTISENNEPFLCAYYIAQEEINVSTLRNYLEEKLPSYMIPSYYMKIDEIPFTSNNKIDTEKLPKPNIGISSREYIEPTNTEEKVICEIWEEDLGIRQVGILDNFFTLGGDSLKAIGLISKINQRLSSSLVVADIYSNPTVKELAASVKSDAGEKYSLLKEEAEKELQLFQENYKSNNEFLDIYEEVYPMNGIEKGMVFHSLLDNSKNVDDILYHEQNMYGFPMKGFDFQTFKQALQLVVNKHGEFRKIYDLENFAHIILKEIEPEIHYIDLCNLAKEEQEKFIDEKCYEEKLKETNLSMSLIWRMHILKVRQDYQYLLFDFNHSLIDGWSLATFVTELFSTYLNLKNNENYRPKSIQASYRDQILEELAAAKNESSKEYWKKELLDYKRFELAPTGLPYELFSNCYDLGKEYRKKVELVADNLNTSFKHLCYAALTYSLKRISYENDLTIGVVTNIRPLIPDGENLVGCFLNTIPFRVKIQEDSTWRDYVNYIESKLINLKYHERVPFNKVLEFIEEKTTEGNPVFDVKLNYIDFRVYNEVELDTEDFLEKSQFDGQSYLNENTPLNLTVCAHNDDFILNIIHSTSYIENEQSQKLFEYFKNALDQILEDVDQKQQADRILIEEDYFKLTEQFNDTKVVFTNETTILDLFKTQVKTYPNNIAVTFENTSLTYKELDKSSNQLAHKLIDMGVKQETLVPISVDRSLEMIIGILAILKAGGAYVPVDPTYPQKRIDYIMEDVQSPFVLTQSRYSDSFEVPKLFLDDTSIYSKESTSSPEVKIKDSSLAYVIYTSGTTGNPKGVMNAHAGIYNRLLWMQDHFAVTSKDNVLQKTNFCFDVSVWELILPLISGSRLVFAKPEGHKDPKYIEQVLIDESITLMHFVPSMLSIFLSNLKNLNGTKLRNVVCSGEELKLSTVKEFQNKFPDVGLHNLYGPTEAAIDVTAIELTDLTGKRVPIGYPISNTQIYIVNKENEIQPIGAKGELLIGGVQVARGYLNKPELTAQKFIPNKFDEKDNYKLYRTGDFARWLPDGTIEYLGRMDNQVKLRGNRIELEEIETSLYDHPKINIALVDFRKYNNDFHIIGYYTSDEAEPIEIDELKNYLETRLPLYMIPSYFVRLDEVPLTSNGKLDKASLPEPEILRLTTHVNPSNKTEEQLLDMWSQILNVEKDRISVTTSFFNIGGNSLNAMALANEILKIFSVDIVLSEIFAKQTIKALADYILTIKQIKMDSENAKQNAKILI